MCQVLTGNCSTVVTVLVVCFWNINLKNSFNRVLASKIQFILSKQQQRDCVIFLRVRPFIIILKNMHDLIKNLHHEKRRTLLNIFIRKSKYITILLFFKRRKRSLYFASIPLI
jgi:hypothetical protein